MHRIILVAIATALALAPARRASANIFSVPAAACVPDNGTTAARAYTISAGTVKYQGTSLGRIQFNCVIPGTLPLSPWHFFIVYSNTNGGSTVGGLYARVSKSTGSVDQLAGVSGLGGTSGVVTVWQSGAIDPATYGNFFVYYVNFSIERTSTSDNPIIYAVGLN